MQQKSTGQPVPALVRLGSRGSCQASLSDVSSLELYGVYSVNVDPVDTIRGLRAVLRRGPE